MKKYSVDRNKVTLYDRTGKLRQVTLIPKKEGRESVYMLMNSPGEMWAMTVPNGRGIKRVIVEF